MNDSKKNDQLTDQERPTGLMGTQFALNMSQGIIDALEEAGVTKIQMLGWDQKELRATAKKVTEKILGLANTKKADLWSEEKAKISHFYKTCFKDKKWKNPDWEHSVIPEGNENMKRPEFIFPEMPEQEAFNAYADYFGKDEVWKAWENISKAIDRTTVQSRPKQNYSILHVGGDEPDLLGKSYNDGISENIIFMTPLEGIISAFRYRFETGKMYDIVGLTRLSALDRDGDAVSMYKDLNGKFYVDSRNRGNRNSRCGLRQVRF